MFTYRSHRQLHVLRGPRNYFLLVVCQICRLSSCQFSASVVEVRIFAVATTSPGQWKVSALGRNSKTSCCHLISPTPNSRAVFQRFRRFFRFVICFRGKLERWSRERLRFRLWARDRLDIESRNSRKEWLELVDLGQTFRLCFRTHRHHVHVLLRIILLIYCYNLSYWIQY